MKLTGAVLNISTNYWQISHSVNGEQYKRVFMFFTIIMLFSSSVFAHGGGPGLHKGKEAPDFIAKNHEGKDVQLSNYTKKGLVVLIFYRGGWCMYCNRQLQDYQKSIEKFKALGVSVIAVSVDKVEKAAETVKEKKLDFEVISNPEIFILEWYNQLYFVPDDLAKTYKEQYNIDLEAASGRTDHVIAVPATYIINTSNKIIYAHTDVDYKVRKSADDILKIIENLN